MDWSIGGFRVGSAGSTWLIRKIINPEAKFVFRDVSAAQSEAVPYDVPDVEFSDHGNFCRLRRCSTDRGVHRLAESIHDADLENDKSHRIEGFGVELIFKGWTKNG